MVRLAAGLIIILAGCTAAGEAPASGRAAPPAEPARQAPAAETWSPAPPATAADRDANRAPYAFRTPPDHVISLEAVGDTAPAQRHTIRRHGGWARVEDTTRHGTSVHHVSFTAPVTVSFGRRPDGRYAHIYLRRALPYGDDPPPVRRTGDHDVVLGERCDVWNVTGRVLSGYNSARRLSCQTADGIEMWSRYVSERGSVQEMRAVSLERRPVAAAEVTPPADLLDPARWPLTWPGAGGGLQVSLVFDEWGEKWRQEKRYRRIGDLERIEDRDSIQWTDRSTGAWARFDRDSDGRYSTLSINDGHNAVGFDEPVRLDEAAFAFEGESCRWFDMMPGTHDAGRSACLMEDGSLLAERNYSRGGRSAFMPERVDRGRLTPTDLAPPAPVADPANWGLPVRETN